MSNVLLVAVTKVEALVVLRAFSDATGRPWQRRSIGDKTYRAIFNKMRDKIRQ